MKLTPRLKNFPETKSILFVIFFQKKLEINFYWNAHLRIVYVFLSAVKMYKILSCYKQKSDENKSLTVLVPMHKGYAIAYASLTPSLAQTV